MLHNLAALARDLRSSPTPAEKSLWHFLRQRPLGYKFRRQVPIGRYIADFASYEARLVVEADGPCHELHDADAERDAWLEANGWEVARYRNDQIRRAIDWVLADVERRLEARKA